MKCEIQGCGAAIEYNGALLFSPPDKDLNCKKTHICKDCYSRIINMIKVTSVIVPVGTAVYQTELVCKNFPATAK